MSEYVRYDRDGKPVKEETIQEETIKERIDRTTREQMDAGRSKQAIADAPSSPTVNEEESEQDHWRKHFEVSVYRKVGADDLDDFLALCAFRGRPVPSLRRRDYVWLHRNRQEWLLQFSSDENREHLRAASWSEDEPEEVHPDPEYLRGYNDAMRLRDAQERDEERPKVAAEPGSWTKAAIDDISSILGKRGHAYTTEDEFENFIDQARMAGVTTRQIFRGMLGQKLTREKSTYARIEELVDSVGGAPDEEDMAVLRELTLSWLDSIRDICGYGLLWFGHSKREARRDGVVEGDD